MKKCHKKTLGTFIYFLRRRSKNFYLIYLIDKSKWAVLCWHSKEKKHCRNTSFSTRLTSNIQSFKRDTISKSNFYLKFVFWVAWWIVRAVDGNFAITIYLFEIGLKVGQWKFVHWIRKIILPLVSCWHQKQEHPVLATMSLSIVDIRPFYPQILFLIFPALFLWLRWLSKVSNCWIALES